MLLHTPDNTGYLDLVSHEEHKLWLAWLDMQWDTPSRSDWYLMQVAAEIEMLRTSKGVYISSKKLPFRTVKVYSSHQGEEEYREDYQKESLTVEEATRVAKAQWAGVFKGRVETIKKDKDGNRVG